MNRIASILTPAIGMCISFLTPCIAYSHDLKDGVVERDIQMVVFPDRVEIQYTIEMNSTTRDQHAEKLTSAQKTKSSKSESRQNASFGPDIASIRAEWDAYRQLLGGTLGKDIALSINSKRHSVELVSSETVEKHSTKLYFVLAAKFQVPAEEQSLFVRDKNFGKHAGYHRMAIKGRRGVKIQSASAPVLVSKVERTEWSELTQKQQQDASTVTAVISLEDK